MVSTLTEWNTPISPQGSWAGVVPWKAIGEEPFPGEVGESSEPGRNHACRGAEAEQETHAALVEEWARHTYSEPKSTLEVEWEGQAVCHQGSSMSGLSLSQKVAPLSLEADAAPGWV